MIIYLPQTGGLHNDHSLTLECGTPPDLKTIVEAVNYRSLTEKGVARGCGL